MISNKDNYLIGDENLFCSIAVYSAIGQRNEQQDCAGFVLLPESSLTVVCDGMGGLSGGKIASNHVTNRMICAFEDYAPFPRPKSFLVKAATTLDEEIESLSDEKGNRIKAGTTLTAVIIENNYAYWTSAGDSRIYRLRNGNLKQLTSDHTYGDYLMDALRNGQISEEIYKREIVNGAGLISYLGIGNLKIYDCDSTEIISGDRFLLMTDGMYKLVTHEELINILSIFSNVADAFYALDNKAIRYAKKNNIVRDNATIAIITIK